MVFTSWPFDYPDEVEYLLKDRISDCDAAVLHFCSLDMPFFELETVHEYLNFASFEGEGSG